MDQVDMLWDTFIEISKNITPADMVSLQGEGEPTLWPHFREAVLHLKSLNIPITSILNGTILDVELISNNFEYIGISVDSLNEEECNKLGRVNLQKVLRNIEELSTRMAHHRIHIYTTDYGQHIGEVRQFAVSHQFIHHIQRLQPKDDYTKHYTGQHEQQINFFNSRPTPKRCDYLDHNTVKYFTVTGTELPCCFIKESTGWPGATSVKGSLSHGIDVPWCRGCRNLTPIN